MLGAGAFRRRFLCIGKASKRLDCKKSDSQKSAQGHGSLSQVAIRPHVYSYRIGSADKTENFDVVSRIKNLPMAKQQSVTWR